MYNNLSITTYDFENICRTCLSRDDLKPLYEKCLAEKYMFVTHVQCVEDDGLPAKICTNCIHEINQAFSFAKRCESTDTILRKCLIKTELLNDSSKSQIFEPITEHIKEEMKPEIIFPNTRRCVQKVLGNFKDIEEVKQEDVKLKLKPEIISSNMHQTMEEAWIKQEEEDMNIEYECVVIHDDSTEKNYEENDDKDQDEMYSEECDNSGSTCDDSLNSHLKHVCSICNKVLISSSNLQIHMRKHAGENPYNCKVCGQTFIQTSNLNIHMRVHTGEKPYSCILCKTAYRCANSLKDHMRMHIGEKPYSCKLCRRAFRRTNGLKDHMRTHTGEKPYICKVCSKSFIQSTTFNNHMRIHTGEKPHICKVCSKGFTQLTTFKNHMRMHTGEKPYGCKLCSKAFSRNDNLKIHMRIHAGKKSYTSQ